jgi:chromosome segregation ATPase
MTTHGSVARSMRERIEKLTDERDALRAEVNKSEERRRAAVDEMGEAWMDRDRALSRADRAEAALDAAAIALENQAHSAGSWHEDEMRMDAARDAGKAARAALRAAAPAEECPKCKSMPCWCGGKP